MRNCPEGIDIYLVNIMEVGRASPPDNLVVGGPHHQGHKKHFISLAVIIIKPLRTWDVII